MMETQDENSTQQLLVFYASSRPELLKNLSSSGLHDENGALRYRSQIGGAG
jgi:hypothetical protein